MPRPVQTSDVRYLHLGQSGIYTRELFRYLHRTDHGREHQLLTRRRGDATSVDDEPYPGWLDVQSDRTSFLVRAMAKGRRAEKVIIHGLFDSMILALLAMAPDVRAKSTWILWGGDLYGHLDPPTSTRQWIERRVRRAVIARIPQIATHIPGDAELCRKHFGWHGHYLNAITYPNTTVAPGEEVSATAAAGGAQRPLRVLAGNSASRTNRLEDLILRLAACDDGTMQVFSALAYGDAEVRQGAIDLGRSTFGERFRPMVTMAPYGAYLAFLKTIDVAVFNHDRQEGVGNILTLLAFGKRVFLHRNTTTWSLLEGLGVDASDAAQLDLDPLPTDTANRNVRIMQSAYGQHRLDSGLEALLAPIPMERGFSATRPGSIG